MRTTGGAGRVFGATLAIALMSAGVASCSSSARTSSGATTTTTSARVVAGGGGGAGGAGGGGGARGGGEGKNSGNTPNNPPADSTTTTTVLPNGPYVVKQTQTLGGETISGTVCNTRAPFRVAAATSKVSWNFLFNRGTMSYAYTIPGAGESHAATGTYTLSKPDVHGVVHLTLAGRDRVVFHGFNGAIPIRYGFDLVPAANTPCPMS